jgi:hypothetical protein
MAANRIQFQPGMSLPQFMELYGTEEKCEAALEQARWPEGFICPFYGEKTMVWSMAAVSSTSVGIATIKRPLPLAQSWRPPSSQ